MRLEIGPFPSAGGHEWIAQARQLVQLLRAGAPLPFAVPTEVLTEFEHYFDDWACAAADDGEFVWSRDVDPAVLKALVTYWFNLAQMLVDHPEHQPPGSMEARVFYRNLSGAILAQLAEEDPEFRALAERWPQL
jgi:hypothetical protein